MRWLVDNGHDDGNTCRGHRVRPDLCSWRPIGEVRTTWYPALWSTLECLVSLCSMTFCKSRIVDTLISGVQKLYTHTHTVERRIFHVKTDTRGANDHLSRDFSLGFMARAICALWPINPPFFLHISSPWQSILRSRLANGLLSARTYMYPIRCWFFVGFVCQNHSQLSISEVFVLLVANARMNSKT